MDERKEMMKNTEIKVEDVFVDNVGEIPISAEQMFELNNFATKMMWIKILVLRYIYLNIQKNIPTFNRVILSKFQVFSY